MKLKQTLEEHLLMLETKLLQPEVRKSEKELSELIHDDFIEFASSGKIYNKLRIITELKHSEECKYSMMNFYLQQMSEGTALVTYHATAEKACGAKTYSLGSSIWKLNFERWQIIFHQGTRLDNQ